MPKNASRTSRGRGPRARPSAGPSGALSAIEHEVVDLFVRLVGVLKLPRSIGEIYGLLFISPVPLAMDVLTERLRMSKGSASQGLATLRSFGAIREVYIPGDRRNHYVAETELRKLAAGFVKEQIHPRLEQGQEQMARIEEALASLPPTDRDLLEPRVHKLGSWQRRSAKILPMMMRLVEYGS